MKLREMTAFAGSRSAWSGLAFAALLLPLGVAPAAAQAGTSASDRYFPEPGNWEGRAAEQVGMDAALLREAVAFATDPANEGYVMDSIGASTTWEWHGYDNSWVTVDGLKVQSVPGGGHWGGGMFINALDQARFGYLSLNNGRWKDRQLLSEEWFRMATTPGELSPSYGYMNHSLNTRASVPSAPREAFWHSGHGANRIYADAANDLVVVVRWMDGRAWSEFAEKVYRSVGAATRAN